MWSDASELLEWLRVTRRHGLSDPALKAWCCWTALRRVAGAVPFPAWPGCIKRKTPLAGDELTSALDAAVSAADLGDADRHRWWSVANGFQTLMAITALLGFFWLTVLFGLQWL